MKIVPASPTYTILLSQDELDVLYRALLEADPINVNGVSDTDLLEALVDYSKKP